MATYLKGFSHTEVVGKTAFLLILRGLDDLEILLVKVFGAVLEVLVLSTTCVCDVT